MDDFFISLSFDKLILITISNFCGTIITVFPLLIFQNRFEQNDQLYQTQLLLFY